MERDGGEEESSADAIPLLQRNGGDDGGGDGPPVGRKTSFSRGRGGGGNRRRRHPSKRWKCFWLGGILVLLFVLAYVVLFNRRCPEALCAAPSTAGRDRHLVLADDEEEEDESEDSSWLKASSTVSVSSTSPSSPLNLVNYNAIMQDNFDFDLKHYDVMVFLHIQKTGGTTFGKHLVQDIDLQEPCTCRRMMKRPKAVARSRQENRNRKLTCDCFRPGTTDQNWLFSRYSTGWKCGLHPDWTELTSCVDKYLEGLEGHTAAPRRYFYVTFLRDPVSRYLSEFKHVQRGATWRTARHLCAGRPPTRQELPPCYDGQDWLGVQLSEFMSCPSNLALNRQTRMLADLRRVNCYNTTGQPAAERDAELLASAKDNLHKMAFFGLTELQLESQYLFQQTFNLEFKVRFDQQGHDHAANTQTKLDADVLAEIERLNHLDVQLYAYARKLVLKRFDELKKNDADFDRHFANLGMAGSGDTDSDRDGDEDDVSETTKRDA